MAIFDIPNFCENYFELFLLSGLEEPNFNNKLVGQDGKFFFKHHFVCGVTLKSNNAFIKNKILEPKIV